MDYDAIKKLTDKELEQKIDETRVNSYVPGSIYHKFVAEKDARNNERLFNNQNKVEEFQEKVIESQKELLVSQHEFHVTVRDGIKAIVSLLSKGQTFWKALALIILIPIIVGVAVNLLTDTAHHLFPWFVSSQHQSHK